MEHIYYSLYYLYTHCLKFLLEGIPSILEVPKALLERFAVILEVLQSICNILYFYGK